MERILVSSCLLGAAVRYDGRAKTSPSAHLARWREEGRLVAVCPEVTGGLAVPRPAAEMSAGGRVLTAAGDDVTEAFTQGAAAALALVARYGIRLAILKDGSPSCGVTRVYDGTFSGRSVSGRGLTAGLLASSGVRVFSEEQIESAAAFLAAITAS